MNIKIITQDCSDS